MQDLHGYDHPWPGGGGKNKSPLGSTETIPTGPIRIFIDTENPLPEGNYVISFDLVNATYQNATSAFLDFYDANGNNFAYPTVYQIRRVSDNATIASLSQPISGRFYYAVTNHSIRIANFHFNSQSYGQWAGRIENVQLEAGTAPTDYAPYENICPISGHTGAEVTRTGKNLCDDTLISNITYNASGVIVQSPNYATTAKTRIKNNTTYTYYHNLQAQNMHYVNFFDENGAFLTQASIWGNDNTVTFTTPDNAYYVAVTAARQQEINISEFIPAQLELGSTATDYEPFQSDQISVNWEDEAGTVYGGEDEVISGKLKSTMGMVDMGDIDWVRQTGSGVSWFAKNMSLLSKPMKLSATTNATRVLLSCYDYIGFGYAANLVNGKCITNDSLILIRDDSCATAEDFISKVTGQMLCYELAEPVEYTLTGNEMETIYGTNNIWADTEDVTVTYIAKSAKFSFHSPLHTYNFVNLKLFGNTYIEHGKG